MALSTKRLHEVIAEVAGEDAIKIVNFLKDKKNISEFVVAEKTKLDMQTTRHILYALHGYNVASYIRKKDRQKGWYISYWTFHRANVKDLIERLKREKVERLSDQLKKEEDNKDNFYICVKACVRVDFDHAFNLEFKCPECGSLLNLQENAKTISNIKEKLKELAATA